ncbi:MAG: GNAT family N-acetyltransferase [Bacteroidia bacterium]
MLSISKPQPEHLNELVILARETFVQSHGSSASIDDINYYLDEKLTKEKLNEELQDKDSIFWLALADGKMVGYSKIVLNAKNPKIDDNHICKLERIYVDEKYLGKGIGELLFNQCVKEAKENDQNGLWLYVWTENQRALAFYKKKGFKIIADTAFKISPRHSNPNYWMYYQFDKN